MDGHFGEGAKGPAGESDRQLLLAFLAANESPCPLCGYNLHRLTGEVCPECGQRLALRVGAVGLRIGALCACLAPLLMMSGIGAFFIVMTIRYGPPTSGWYYMLLSASVLDGILAYALYRRRAWFLRQERGRQNGLVAASWLSNLAALGGSVLLG